MRRVLSSSPGVDFKHPGFETTTPSQAIDLAAPGVVESTRAKAGQEGKPQNFGWRLHGFSVQRGISTMRPSLLVQEHSLQPTPSPLCGLASWPLLGACSMYPGE